jgi:2-methylcitrate dehydratase PrpD
MVRARNSSNGNPYTKAVATFVSMLRFEHIPAKVIDRIKLLILDSLGCALYSVDLEWSQILIRTLSRLDSSTTCTAWGTSRRLSAPHAALVNGTLIQGFELDDVHRAGVLHVGAVTLPTLVAIAETGHELSGRDFITAAVAGYEVGPRVGLCMGPEHIAQGWHSGATVGTFASAAAGARAMGLSTSQTVHALGIAGTQAAGLMAAQYGSMVKRMHAGRSSQSGLYAALLAAEGFTGISDVFESDYGGFCTTFSRSHDRFDLAQLTVNLGERFETMQVSLKFYSCVGSNHTTLDAVRTMQQRRPFSAQEVDRIVVHGSRATVDHVGWKYVPEGITAAQLNLPFCVATLLQAGDVFVDQFDAKQATDPVRMALAERVTVLEDPDITSRGARYRHMVRVQVHLNDGTELTETVEAPRGSEASFASDEEVIRKYEKLATKVLPPQRAAALRDAVLNLERLSDVREMTRLLSQPGASGA